MSAARMTVFIPTYNRAKYLRHCLRALEQQDIPSSDLEVVISDNASEDETPEVVREFSSLGLRYSRNEKNLGVIGNFNRMLELCDTEFVVLLPDDTLLVPGFLRRATDALSRNEGATMYATVALIAFPSIHAPRAQIFTPSPLVPSRLWPLQLQVWDYESWAAACLVGNPVYTGAAAFRFSFLSEVGPWLEEYIGNADRLTYFEAGRRGQVLFEPWIGAHGIFDGHNVGAGYTSEQIRPEYREVTQYIMEETNKDGIDVLGYWKSNLKNYSRKDQMEILERAKYCLPEETYVRTFGRFKEFTVELTGGRLDRWPVPRRVTRLVRALRRSLQS